MSVLMLTCRRLSMCFIIRQIHREDRQTHDKQNSSAHSLVLPCCPKYGVKTVFCIFSVGKYRILLTAVISVGNPSLYRQHHGDDDKSEIERESGQFQGLPYHYGRSMDYWSMDYSVKGTGVRVHTLKE